MGSEESKFKGLCIDFWNMYKEKVYKKFSRDTWIPQLDDSYKPLFFNPHGLCHAFQVQKTSKELYKKYVDVIGKESDPYRVLLEKLILYIAAISHDLSISSPPPLKKWNSQDGFNNLRKNHGAYSVEIIRDLLREELSLRTFGVNGTSLLPDPKYSIDLEDLFSAVETLIMYHHGTKIPRDLEKSVSIIINGKEYDIIVRLYLLLPILRISDMFDENCERFIGSAYSSDPRIEEVCKAERKGYIRLINKAIAYGSVLGNPEPERYAEQIRYYLRTLVVWRNPLRGTLEYHEERHEFIVRPKLYAIPAKIVFYPQMPWKVEITPSEIEKELRDYYDKEIDPIGVSEIKGYSNKILTKYELPLIRYEIERYNVKFPIEKFFQIPYIKSAIDYLIYLAEKRKSVDALTTISGNDLSRALDDFPRIVIPYLIEDELTHYAVVLNRGAKSKQKTLKVGQEKSVLNPPSFPNELLTLFTLYEPLEFLGEGGFAKVFKVKRKKDGKVVALKIPRIDERTSSLFIKEVAAWYNLNHENIVRLYKADILPVPYLEMEYCDDSLENILRKKRVLPPLEAARIIFDVAEGLKYAHSKGIIHRDLKPSNILLKNGIPKISDWGLAKLGTMSSSRSVMGYTPLYAAPEQLSKSQFGHTDERTDIWALGVLFYQFVTGRLPFEGESFAEVMYRIIKEKPVPPSQFNPNSKIFEPIIMKMLAKKKDERYQSIEELQRDLILILQGGLNNTLEATTISVPISPSQYLYELALMYLKIGEYDEAINYLKMLRDLTVSVDNELDKLISELEHATKEKTESDLNQISLIERKLREIIS